MEKQTRFKTSSKLEVSRYSLKGQRLETYSNLGVAAEALKTVRSNIMRALKPDRYATAKGFLWRYGRAEEMDMELVLKNKRYAGASPLAVLQHKIGAYDFEGNLVKTYVDTKVAGRDVGVHYQGIRKVIRGKAFTYGGFIWRKAPLKKKITVDPKIIELKSLISQYDLNGRWIRSFKTGLEAAKLTGVGNDNISKAINDEQTITAGGFIWRKGSALRINLSELRRNPHFPHSKLSNHLKKQRQQSLEEMNVENKLSRNSLQKDKS